MKGKYGAGDTLWVRDKTTLDYAILLEPDVSRERVLEMLFLQMVALGDSIGALAPPEVAITYDWPNRIYANEAFIGSVNAILSDDDGEDGCPTYLVIHTKIAVHPKPGAADPGFNKDETTLYDEGCFDLNTLQLLESSSRHFMTWLNSWQEEGLKQILQQLDGRMNKDQQIKLGVEEGQYLGMDEQGDAFVKSDGKTHSIAAKDALETRLGLQS